MSSKRFMLMAWCARLAALVLLLFALVVVPSFATFGPGSGSVANESITEAKFAKGILPSEETKTVSASTVKLNLALHTSFFLTIAHATTIELEGAPSRPVEVTVRWKQNATGHFAVKFTVNSEHGWVGGQEPLFSTEPEAENLVQLTVPTGKQSEPIGMGALKGERGERGEAGPTGAKGEKGEKGATGEAEPTWEALSFGSGVASFGGEYAPAKVATTGNGIVMLSGLLKLTEEKTAGTVLFTLPTADRPAFTHVIAMLNAEAIEVFPYRIKVKSNGEVTTLGNIPAAGVPILDGMTFPKAH